jgi:NAD(P)-dependent dehydrogenase (short-subunit alcohol dehydrogenase family)
VAVPVVVVTGSASGMGAATATLLTERGSRVIGIDRSGADICVDLSVAGGRKQAVRQVAEAEPHGITGVATFAGVSGFGRRSGSEVVSVNYFGTIDLLKGLRELLARAGESAAVAIGSNAATTTRGIDERLVNQCLAGDEQLARSRADEVGGPGSYSASKFALMRWVRMSAVSHAWIGSGIALNCVAPGQVETPLVSEMRDDEVGRAVLDRTPIPAGSGPTRRGR